MPPTQFKDVKGHNRGLVRIALEMAIFIKPFEESDSPITSIWSEESGLVIPTGYMPVGMTTKDQGASWTREQETSDVESHGYTEPVRRDIVRDVSGLSFTMQESNKQSMGLYHGLDLGAVVADSSGGFYFDKPSRPVRLKYRVLAVAKDGAGPDAIYFVRWLPSAETSEQPEQAWTEGSEINYPASLTGELDEAVGTAMRELWGGPGLDAVAMGFGS